MDNPPAPQSDQQPPPLIGAGPGAYGEKQDQDGVEFVILNDDVLTSVANATMVLVDGSDLERMAVLYQFPQFLEHCPDDSLTVMVPRICQGAVTWNSEVQMAAAEALYFVVNMKAPQHVAKQIVLAALRIIAKSESGDVFDACGEILSMMLPQVQRFDVLDLVVPATVERAVAANPESRRLAARIIGSLNDSMTADQLERIFLHQALTLAEDPDDSVRAMIAQSLAAVGIKLPLRVSETHLWPKLNTLMQDPNARVRAAAMRAIAKSAEAHRAHAPTSPMYSTLLKPMFLAECQRACEVAASDLRTVSDDTYLMLEIFSEVYGYFLCAVSPLFTDEETWTNALNTLRRMVTCNGPTVRHWCSFNMPAVATVCAHKRTDKIAGVIQALAVDSDVETRATLAAGIHETTRLLCDGPLREEIVQAIGVLLMDENAQVRMNSLGHFSDLFAMLSSGEIGKQRQRKASTTTSAEAEPEKNSAITTVVTDTESMTTENSTSMRRFAPIFASLELMSMDSWRTQELLAAELRKSAHLVPQEMLCEHVAPLLFQMARESTYLVRKASMYALIHVLRYIPDVRRRNHILKHFRLEWARGKVYWTRLAYIDGAEWAHKIFSIKLFTHLFKEELLAMSKDPVPNVRLRLVRFFGDLVPIWKTRPEFTQVLNTFAQDPDPQVANEARVIVESLEASQPLPEQVLLEDQKKEALEEAFYVHKANRKKKKGPKNKPLPDGGQQNVAAAGGVDISAQTQAPPVSAATKQGLDNNATEPRSDITSSKPQVTPTSSDPGHNQAKNPNAISKLLCGCFGGG